MFAPAEQDAYLTGTHERSRTVILNQGSEDQKRKEILAYFQQTFDQYDLLFETLACEEAWYQKAISLRHPLIFYYGHTAAFYINKLVITRHLSERVNADIEAMVAIGVDEMSWDDLDDNNYNWPTVDALKAYRKSVRNVVCDFIQTMPLSVPITWDSPAWLIMMGIEHERIHLETSSVLIRQLPLDWVKDHPAWPICPHSGPAPENALIPQQGDTISIGKERDNPLYGWDNEYGQHIQQVQDFNVSQFLVSNEEYLAFVEDNGYLQEQYWSDEGWAWLTFSQVKHPEFWRQKTSGWHYRTMLTEIPMPWDWPVDVNCHEAQAFCRWKSQKTGKNLQLPSEAEWYLLRNQLDTDQPYWPQAPGNINLEYWASSCPVNHFQQGSLWDVIGNVWQWTTTPIDALPGFEIHPAYDDFSTPTFDGKHNLIKGGCWISTGNYAIKDARYAFRRHFFQHAGFRYVESSDTGSHTVNPYETDALVSQYLEFHYGGQYFGVANFPKACADLCLQYASDKATRALDLGCATGRTSFELARHFHHVDGVDFSARFINAASELQQEGRIRYCLPTEGELVDYHETSLEDLALDNIDVQRIRFTQGDACNLKPVYTNYDLIFAGNLIDRLRDPHLFLSNIHTRLRNEGLLILTSPYTWLEEFTPTSKWLGGYRENGETVDTLTGLHRILDTHFIRLDDPVDIPFVIRETARKHQHTIAQCTVWRKRS